MIDEKNLIEKIKWTDINIGDDPLLLKITILSLINEQPKIGEWIPVAERLPEERNSMFAEFKGTRHWTNAMFEKISSTVMATVVLENGARTVEPAHTVDGKWKMEATAVIKKKVIAWMPLPEPYMEEKLWVD